MTIMSLATLPAYLRHLQGGKRRLSFPAPTVAWTCKFEHHTNLCASWQTERQKDHGANKFSMRQQYKNSYQFTKPPKALLKARLDNIAIVPASMLPLAKILKEKVNTLPKGGVFLCYAQENSRQKKILERVGETFRVQGHVVRSLSMREASTTPPHF